MKQVTLKSLTLCNFKGEKERTTNFNPDVTTIRAATGWASQGISMLSFGCFSARIPKTEKTTKSRPVLMARNCTM